MNSEADNSFVNYTSSSVNYSLDIIRPTQSDIKAGTTVNIIYLVIVIPMLVYGVATNVLFLCAVFTRKRLRGNTSYWLLCSLALSDIVFLLAAAGQKCFNLISSMFGGALVLRSGVPCYLISLLHLVTLDSNPVHMILLCLNRYVASVKFVHYKRAYTPSKTCLQIILAWLMPISVFALVTNAWSPVGYFPLGWICKPRSHAYTLYLGVARSFVALPILLILYALILRRIRESKASVSGERDAGRILAASTSQHQERRLTQQFGVVTLVSCAAWSAFLVTMCCQWAGLRVKELPLVTSTLMVVNSAINPTIYALYNSQLTLRAAATGHIARGPAQQGSAFNSRTEEGNSGKPRHVTVTSTQMRY